MDGLTYDSESYTFQEPRGLLFSTQFAQPAITLMNLAETASLQSRGLMQQDAYFAGHSLGEYSALAACANFMPLEALLGLVFYRGTVMQFAMEKDSSGQTEFSMVAVNPSRVERGTWACFPDQAEMLKISLGFDQASLKMLVHDIASKTELLLEVVNYNVEQQQYVCAGHVSEGSITTSRAHGH